MQRIFPAGNRWSRIAAALVEAFAGSLGQVWHVPKSVVYRSAERLVQLGLITAVDKYPGNLGLARSRLEVTSKGDQVARDWLRQPVTQPGAIVPSCWSSSRCWAGSILIPGTCCRSSARSLYLLLRRLRQTHAATGFDRTLALWRHEPMSATFGSSTPFW
jgi:PadR family transcriptional regulator AphA